MAASDEKRCPDCDGSLLPIKLFARTEINTKLSSYYSDGDVIRYAAAKAERGKFFQWTYDVAGQVSAMMCSSCNRIFLYGQPGAG
jgi:hypothetical protein